MIFRLVVVRLPHASYAYKNYWLCDRCDRDFMLKKNQLPSMTSKRSHHLIKLRMLIGFSIQLRNSLQRYHRLSPPLKYFTDISKVVLLMFFPSCVCYVFVRVCLYVLCNHLLGKGWPLGSRLWCLAVSLSLSHWYPGPGVVFGCIDS